MNTIRYNETGQGSPYVNLLGDHWIRIDEEVDNDPTPAEQMLEISFWWK